MTLAGLVVAVIATIILVLVGIWLFGARLAPALAIAVPSIALRVGRASWGSAISSARSSFAA